MFGITLGRTGEKIVAIADIESGSAGVAIAALHTGKPAQILVAERAALPFEERGQEQAASGVIAKLSEAGEKALAAYAGLKKNKPITESYAIIRAPWATSKTVRATSAFEKAEKVTDKTISELARQALAQDKETNPANVLEATVVRVQLNGYPTSKPVGKRAKEVAVSVLQSECDPNIRTQAAETLTKLFPHSPPKFRSATRALIAVLRESTGLPEDCLVIDMAGDASSVFAVRHGSVAEHIVVPEGARTILKRVAGEKMPEEALSLMRLVASDTCDEATCNTLAASLARAEPELVRIFGEGMARLVAAKKLPNPMVLSVQSDMASWLTHVFSRIDFTQFTVTAQPFSPKALSQDMCAPFAAYRAGVVPDLGLSVASALVNIEQ